MYHPKLGKMVAANCVLRAWGSIKTLDVKGMCRTTISTTKAATKRSWIYIVGGHKPEPLLGDKDAAALGIMTFNPEGRDPKQLEGEQQESEEGRTIQKMEEMSIPEKLRKAGFSVDTQRGPVEVIKLADKEAAMHIVSRFHSTVFLPGIGCIKTEPVKFSFSKDFKPVQPPRRRVP